MVSFGKATSTDVQEMTPESPGPTHTGAQPFAMEQRYRVYKRRYFGLAQLALLNVIVSWDWLTFAASSTTCADYFNVSEADINWLSTAFMFAFLVTAPAVIWVLNRYPPKMAIVVSSVLVLVGNWIRFAGARAGSNGNFGLLMFGQIICGFAQPFALASPTRYSDAWFSSSGRVSATAVASLANPLGGALGQLVGPLWATSPDKVPSMVLYTAIIATIATIPSFFLPGLPPTPPSPSTDLRETRPWLTDLRLLVRNRQFWLLMLPFSIFVGAFNATSSLLNQVFEPYGFSENQAGVAGAVLIFVGLGCSAISSPIIDRTKQYTLWLKMLMPLIAVCYLVLIFIPQTRSFGAVCVIMALIGGASFALLPCALEWLVEITYPVSPEASSVVAWAAGQFIGSIFLIVMTALKGPFGKTTTDQPADTLIRALVMQAVFCMVVLVPGMLLGVGVTSEQQKRRLMKETPRATAETVGEPVGPGTLSI